MRVINGHVGNHLYNFADGETFEYNGSYWLVSDYTDTEGTGHPYTKILYVNLETGKAEFVTKEFIVVPINAEVHIL